MDPELEEIIHGPNITRSKRNAVREKKLLWKTRIIPYYVPSHMSNNFYHTIIDNFQNMKFLCFLYVVLIT